MNGCNLPCSACPVVSLLHSPFWQCRRWAQQLSPDFLSDCQRYAAHCIQKYPVSDKASQHTLKWIIFNMQQMLQYNVGCSAIKEKKAKDICRLSDEIINITVLGCSAIMEERVYDICWSPGVLDFWCFAFPKLA